MTPPSGENYDDMYGDWSGNIWKGSLDGAFNDLGDIDSGPFKSKGKTQKGVQGSFDNYKAHATGVQTAFELEWENGKKTTITGGGESYGGGMKSLTTGVDLVVSAVNVILDGISIAEDMKCAEQLKKCRAKRILQLHWKDFGAPDYDQSFWIQLCLDIHDLELETVHLQCMGGNGRTGTMMAIIFQTCTQKFKTVADLVAHIRSVYRKEAVESEVQFEYIAKVCEMELGDITGMYSHPKFVAAPASPAAGTQLPINAQGQTLISSPSSGGAHTDELSEADAKVAKSPDFVAFDQKHTQHLFLSEAVAIFKAWVMAAKPKIISLNNDILFQEVNPMFVVFNSPSFGKLNVNPCDIVTSKPTDKDTKGQ